MVITLLSLRLVSKSRGASFCQVNKIKHWDQRRLIIIFGNQKCRGGIPAFMIIAKKINISIASIFNAMERERFMATLTINIIDARAWIKKYLIEASTNPR